MDKMKQDIEQIIELLDIKAKKWLKPLSVEFYSTFEC